jgi:hypothetical protein
MFRAKPSMRAFVVQLLVDFFLDHCAHPKATCYVDAEIASDPSDRIDSFSPLNAHRFKLTDKYQRSWLFLSCLTSLIRLFGEPQASLRLNEATMPKNRKSGKAMKRQAFCECRYAVQNAGTSTWRTTWSRSSQGYPQLFNRFCGKRSQHLHPGEQVHGLMWPQNFCLFAILQTDNKLQS